MTTNNFSDFFAAVHGGRRPFQWQERLAAMVLKTSTWPETISVPTASGKTSTLDIAVFALAEQADRPASRRSPLRIFFVVDRRLVVDDVSLHAEKLAEAIERGGSDPVDRVRERLKRFGGPRPLDVATLRGGMYRSDTWADAPNQPLICVSTVDQIGSRLLFRGYGVSESLRPVHAGLVGNDSLVLVDEAHLSTPFLDTLRWVQKYQGDAWAEQHPAPGLRLVEMSATVRDRESPFRLSEKEWNDAHLKPRLHAQKLAELKEVANLEQAAVEEASALANAGTGVVGILLNTVASARATFDAIPVEDEQKILLTGRARPYDRDGLLKAHLHRIQAGRVRTAGEPTFFVVATQTVEVGADVDFDALVTEAAPLDSLRQRFGRLDRLGELQQTNAVILKPRRSLNRAWIYGPALDNTWSWLQKHASEKRGRLLIDFGALRMDNLVESHPDSSVNSSSEPGPIMFPAHLEAWVQTNPAPAADPDVAPFLHGSRALDAPDVQMVWRADLEQERVSAWPDILGSAPPVATEALPLPIGVARRWLRRRISELTDVEGTAEQADEGTGDRIRPFLIWRGPDNSRTDLSDLRPGDTIVVRSSEGGADRFGWAPLSALPVDDIGDLAANRRVQNAGGRCRLRVNPGVLFPRDVAKQEALSTLLNLVRSDDEEALTDLKQLVRDGVTGQAELEFAAKHVNWQRAEPYTAHGLLAESRWMRAAVRRVSSNPEETDENDTASLTGRQVLLSDHSEGVVSKVSQFAVGCGISGPLTAALTAAATRHDLGKWDHRFQMLLSDRDINEPPLAKGRTLRPRAFRGRRQLSGYPAGARHEFASVAMADAGNWQEECDRKLVLHLIGTHHGYGRPFVPVWTDDPNLHIRARMNGDEIAVSNVPAIARLDSNWVDQFWWLSRQYGWWGLAYLEAILRRADCVCSREEQEAES